MSTNFGRIVRRFGSRIQIQEGIDGLYRVYLDKVTNEFESASKREAIEFAEQMEQRILFGNQTALPDAGNENMKVAYIAHPISGDIHGNLNKIKDIGRKINLEEPEVVPFAHYFFDCYALDDNVPEERDRGIKNDIALMRKGFIDEVRLYGDRISNGMLHEIKLAVEVGIPVVPMTDATKREFQIIEFNQTALPDAGR